MSQALAAIHSWRHRAKKLDRIYRFVSKMMLFTLRTVDRARPYNGNFESCVIAL